MYLLVHSQIRLLFGSFYHEEGMATHSSVLAWRISQTEEPGGLWSIESQGVNTTEKTLHTHMHREVYFMVCLQNFYSWHLLSGICTFCPRHDPLKSPSSGKIQIVSENQEQGNQGWYFCPLFIYSFIYFIYINIFIFYVYFINTAFTI